MNYLFFRTDRVGDLIVSSILFKSIKRKNGNNKIFLVCSIGNAELARQLSFIDKVFVYKKGFFNKLKILIEINFLKISSLLVLDGKDRSILFSLFIFAKKKIYIINKKKFFFLFRNNKTNLIFDDENKNYKIDIIIKILSKLDIIFSNEDLNIFKNEYFFKSLKERKLKFLDNCNYNLLHYDEKWIVKSYIETYKNIELNFDNLNIFLNNIINKSQMDLVITSGKKISQPLDDLKKTMKFLDEGVYVKKNNNNFLYYIDQPSFNELTEVIYKSKLCITCHGAPTHISSTLNIKTIDIIDLSKISLYRAYTKHLRNYNEVIRESAKDTTKKILTLL